MAAEVESLQRQICNSDEKALPNYHAMDETEPDTPDIEKEDDAEVPVLAGGVHSPYTNRHADRATDTETGRNADKNIDDEKNQLNRLPDIDVTSQCNGDSGLVDAENPDSKGNDNEESTLIFQADESTLVLDIDPKTLEIEPEDREDKTLEWTQEDAAMHNDESAGQGYGEDEQTLAYAEPDGAPSPTTAGPSIDMSRSTDSCENAQVAVPFQVRVR